jgi:predicted RNA-binding Zn ribbon-like protein
MADADISKLQLDGGCPAFDFVNTINNRFAADGVDYLVDYDDLFAWCRHTSLLPKKSINALAAKSKEKKRTAMNAFSRAIAAREVLYVLFTAIIRKEKIPADTIAKFNQLLSHTLSKIKIGIAVAEARLSFQDEGESFDEPLNLIVKSAFDILTRENFDRIRQCSSCGWLFLDTTKNGRRRWCDMKVCGSNDKAKRYYYRKKNENAEQS